MVGMGGPRHYNDHGELENPVPLSWTDSDDRASNAWWTPFD